MPIFAFTADLCSSAPDAGFPKIIPGRPLHSTLSPTPAASFLFLCNRISCGTSLITSQENLICNKKNPKCYNPKMDGFEVRTPTIFVCRRVDAQHGWCSFLIIGDNYRCNRTSGYDTNDISYWYKHDINYIMYDIDIVWYICIWYMIRCYMIHDMYDMI